MAGEAPRGGSQGRRNHVLQSQFRGFFSFHKMLAEFEFLDLFTVLGETPFA